MPRTIAVIDVSGRELRFIPKAEARREIAAGQAVKVGKGPLTTIQITGNGTDTARPMSHVYEESGHYRMYRMVLKTCDGVEVAI